MKNWQPERNSNQSTGRQYYLLLLLEKAIVSLLRHQEELGPRMLKIESRRRDTIIHLGHQAGLPLVLMFRMG
jgi:hypothetical protein